MSGDIEVRLLNYPLDLFLRAQEHADDLLREFVLISRSSDVDPARVRTPARLVALVDELTTTYEGMSELPRADRDAAIERGELRVDLVYVFPLQALEPVRHLGRALDEADDFCREGQHLLTLETPPDLVAFRHWFVGEFERQAAGQAPLPWPH